MLIEFGLALLLGILAGTITGLTPGIHTNLIAGLLIASLHLFSQVPLISFIVFVTALAITHTFLDFIPSIYLGAPDEDTALVTLPGHKMLLFGQGHKAVMLTLAGSLLAVACLLVIVPIFILIVPKIFPFIQRMLAWFLLWISILLILNERKFRLSASIIFVMAGFLGIATLNSGMSEPLLPLLTGLFGSSTLIYSIKKNTSVPQQMVSNIKIKKRDLVRPALITMLVSPICSFFPGLGSSQAAIIGSQLSKEQSKEQFMILLGSINTLVISISFVTLFLVQKSRTGAASAIKELTTLTPQDLALILTTILLATLLAVPLTSMLSKLCARNIHRVNYTKISIAIITLLTTIILLVTGITGLIVFSVSTTLGLLCSELQVRKGFLMGCLLIPTILFYVPF